MSRKRVPLNQNECTADFRIGVPFEQNLHVICFLINYTTKFMFEKRSKELGTYMLLGIEKKEIAHLVVIENLAVTTYSFGVTAKFLYKFRY